jgi:hypothetical protein
VAAELLHLPSPRSRNRVLSVLRWLWTLPTTLVGHAIGAIVCQCRPREVGSDVARAHLYVLPDASLFRRIGAVTIGHVIICSPQFICGELGRLVLAHELSHVRQHDWLGPFYLPVHLVAQLVSVVLYWLHPVPRSTPQHSHNPLELTFLAVPYSALREYEPPFPERVTLVLRRFGV